MPAVVEEGPNMPMVERLKHLTPTVAFIMVYMAGCAFNFGYDVGNFGGVQGMQSFAKKFGQYNAQKDLWALPAYLSSVMTSTPFIGKAIGAIVAAQIAERYGRKIAVFILAILSLIGVTLQTSATTAAQFTVGRIINFAMTGFTIVVVPIYQAETAPRELRGMLNSTIQLMIIIGQLVASLVNYGTQHMTTDAGWQIPVGLQFITPVLILAFLYLIPESPRWLLSRGRVDEAVQSLKRISKKSKPPSEIEMEIEALRHVSNNEGKGSWKEVFNKKNRVRTAVAILAMFGQQITGQAFVSQYSTIFYQQQGFKDQAFLFTVLNNVAAFGCVFITWFVIDGVGRRPILLLGGALMASFLYIVGGIATVPHPNLAEKNTMVASVILFGSAYNISWGPVSYVVLSEASASRVKEKTSQLAIVISVLTTFVTSFTIPYLINAPYANLGGKVGFVYGSICWASVVVAYFCIPELKGRSLEEVDQLFASGASLRKFRKIETRPVEADVQDLSLEAKESKAVEIEVSDESYRV